MKTCKKALAVLLCVLMALSCTVLCVSAEDEPVQASVSGVKATQFDPADPETVPDRAAHLRRWPPCHQTFSTQSSSSFFSASRSFRHSAGCCLSDLNAIL